MIEFASTFFTAIMAITVTILSVITGMRVLGNARLWQFQDGLKPYIEGHFSAWVYALILVSTILSIFHMGLLVDWVSREGRFLIGETLTDYWNMWHTAISAFVSSFHILVHKTMIKRKDHPHKQVHKLWK